VLVLVVAACEANRASRLFGRFFGSARRQAVQPTCEWLANPGLLKELQWKEEVDLCFETGPKFAYPEQQIQVALQNDPAATEFLGYLTSCYNYGQQNYKSAWNQALYSQDLCPVRPRNVQMVWRHNHLDHKMDHCYIVHPDQQRVAMAQCGEKGNHPDAQKCKRDALSVFEGNYYCVPDGFVRRTVLIYCPWDPEVQCRPAQVRIPTGCSCKQYMCDKQRANAAGALAGLASIQARFNLGK